MKIKGRNVWFHVGVDLAGDACLYANVLKPNGGVGRYASTSELGQIAEQLNSVEDIPTFKEREKDA